MRGFSILWLLLNTKIGNVILGLFIVYILIYVFEWWLIPIIAVIVGAFYINIAWENRQNRKLAKKRELEDRRIAYLENSYKEERRRKREEARAKKEAERKLKKLLSKEEVGVEISKALEKHPGAICDVLKEDGYPIYRVYWLDVCNKTGETDNNIFDVKFTMQQDCQGMIVTITNKCKAKIDVNWMWFKINRQRVVIDGIDYDEYNESGIIEPGKTVAKMVQPYNYEDGCIVKMFDLDKIKKEELIYDVSIRVKCGRMKEKIYSYRLRTTLRIIS